MASLTFKVTDEEARLIRSRARKERVTVSEYSDSHPTSQETKLFRRFSDIVLSATVDPHWADIALKTQIIMDACLKSARNGSVEVEL